MYTCPQSGFDNVVTPLNSICWPSGVHAQLVKLALSMSGEPSLVVLARVTTPVARSLTYTAGFGAAGSAPGAGAVRLVALEKNATRVPSGLNATPALVPSAGLPSWAALSRPSRPERVSYR